MKKNIDINVLNKIVKNAIKQAMNEGADAYATRAEYDPAEERRKNAEYERSQAVKEREANEPRSGSDRSDDLEPWERQRRLDASRKTYADQQTQKQNAAKKAEMDRRFGFSAHSLDKNPKELAMTLYSLSDQDEQDALENDYFDLKAYKLAKSQYPKVLDPNGKRRDPQGKRYYIKGIDSVGAFTAIKNIFKEEIARSIKNN